MREMDIGKMRIKKIMYFHILRPERLFFNLIFIIYLPDSELIVRQIDNKYQIKEETLWPQYMKVHNLLVAHFSNIHFTHIPREKNKEADALVNEAIDERM